MRKAQRDRRVALFIASVIVIICIAGIIRYQITLRAQQEVQEGLEKLRELEEKKVALIEDNIAALEEEERKEEEEKLRQSEEYKNRPLKEKFGDTLVMGDSITEGLSAYKVLNKDNVMAEIGISLTKAKKIMEKAAGLNRKKIFLCYGMNDIGMTNGDAGKFKEQYREAIIYLKEHIDGVEIYVNSILPVQEKYKKKHPMYRKVDQYNKALMELCKEEDAVYIDNSSLVKESYYEPDGVHMSSEYYPKWANHMAEVAKL